MNAHQYKTSVQSKFKLLVAAKVSFLDFLGSMKVGGKPILKSLNSLASGLFKIEANVALMVSAPVEEYLLSRGSMRRRCY